MEKGILFNTEMVKAILEGRKTCTRRIVKDVKELDFIGIGMEPKEIKNTAAFGHGNFEDIVNAKVEKHIKAPCILGDILYVRETWFEGDILNSNDDLVERNIVLYKTDDLTKHDIEEMKWRPSIHMPKRLARIFLKVVDVRVERLQDITEDQIKKEGIKEEFPPLAQDKFRDLWGSTLKKEQLKMYGWNANPYVWVIEFEVINK